MHETLDFIKMVEQTGVSAITIHGRTVPERPKNPAHWVIRNTFVYPLSLTETRRKFFLSCLQQPLLVFLWLLMVMYFVTMTYRNWKRKRVA